MGDASDIKKTLELQTGPRAAGHYGPDLEVMKRAGVYDIFAEVAHFQDRLMFRAPPYNDGQGGKKAGRNIALIEDLQLTLPQSTMVPLLAKELEKTGLGKIHFGKEVVAVEQDETGVTISIKDGKTGQVEKSRVNILWEQTGAGPPYEILLVSNFLASLGKKESSQQMYAIGLDAAETRSDEELLKEENIMAGYDYLMPGPRPIKCEIEAKAVYYIHQRLASTIRRGRVLLAGDAAHICNPLGTMGLTLGILDSEALADALIMVINDGLPADRVLTLYSNLRRQVFGYFINPMFTQNKFRVASNADDLERDDGFIRLLKLPEQWTWSSRVTRIIGELI
ncbi:FAD/NAD(P)-binding domain-containing protein [Cadophora sp. DSE1049]|nr:FAD/NAD(P)-binding domain-containing protein [Cadophora sp. DSE1049]